MATIGLGVKKQTRFARQSAKGTIAVVGGGQILRREQSTFELAKETYTTESEITSTQQLLSNRHGVRTVNGKLSGIFSPGTYADQLSALLRRDFTAVTAIAAASFTIAGAGPTWTITRAAGSFLTDGAKIGHVVRLTAGGFNAANLNKNLLVSAVSALVITVQLVYASGVALVAEGPITAATMSFPGKVTYAPPSGHTNVYYTVEEWYPDVPASERNLDVKIGSVDIKMPGSGNTKIDFSCLGLDQSAAATVYFTAPTAETSSGALVGASGILLYNGVAIATITDVSLKIDGKEQAANGVVGNVVRPDIFRGKVMVTGSITAYFDSTTLPDQFRAETSCSMILVLSTGSSATADFVAITIPWVELNSSTPMDGETGMTRTYNIVAEYLASGGAGTANEQTTLYIQDSLAP